MKKLNLDALDFIIFREKDGGLYVYAKAIMSSARVEEKFRATLDKWGVEIGEEALCSPVITNLVNCAMIKFSELQSQEVIDRLIENKIIANQNELELHGKNYVKELAINGIKAAAAKTSAATR